MKMLQQLKSKIVQKLSASASFRKPEESAEPDLEGMTEQLFEIAGELDVVMTAFLSSEFSDSQSFGLYLILRRQTNRIRLIGTEMCAYG